jgi:hypothetical protein
LDRNVVLVMILMQKVYKRWRKQIIYNREINVWEVSIYVLSVPIQWVKIVPVIFSICLLAVFLAVGGTNCMNNAFFHSLFYYAFSVTRLYSVNDRVTSEWWWWRWIDEDKRPCLKRDSYPWSQCPSDQGLCLGSCEQSCVDFIRKPAFFATWAAYVHVCSV